MGARWASGQSGGPARTQARMPVLRPGVASSRASLPLGLDCQRHCARFGDEILSGDALHVIGGNSVNLIQRSEDLSPVAISDRDVGEQRSQSGVAIELPNHSGTRLGFYTGESDVVHFLIFEPLQDVVKLFLILINRFSGRRY